MSDLTIESVSKKDAIVKTMVTDLAGGFKEIFFPASALPEICKSGVAYDGSSFQGINDINTSDSILKGVIETLIQVPEEIADTEKEEFWIICEIIDINGKPHPNCARSKLRELQGVLGEQWDGGNLYTGAEPESFFVEVDKKIGKADGGNSNYFNTKDPKSSIILEIVNALMKMDFEIERSHTEVGEDQFEINWKYDIAERTADRIQIYKLVSHKIARNFGYDVTFLPKPYPSRNGSGMHIHISVSNDKANLFYDEKATGNKSFSDKSLSFLGGILENARGISAVGNPTEVSFARLVPGFEAPCIVAIGEHNRTVACRIPAIADKSTMKYAIRAEFRFPDPMANPYLLSAAFIAAGLEGLDKALPAPDFCDENLYEFSLDEIEAKGLTLLPRNLWEAVTEFRKSEALKKYLGESICKNFAGLLVDEIDSCQPYANTESMRKHYFR